MSSKTHYEILGVSQNASEQEIKKAYRSLSLKYHPDKNSEEDAQSRFQEISAANDIIGDPEKRKQYDFELAHGSESMFGTGFPPGFPGGGFGPGFGGGFSSPMDDIFQMMFEGGLGGGMGGGMPNIRIFHSGGGNGPVFIKRQSAVQKPPPIVKEISLTLEQAFSGTEVVFMFERIVVFNGIQTTEQDQIKFQTPVGINEGEIISIPEKGHVTNPIIKGDLQIHVKYLSHSIFTRQGNDLVCQKHISLKESLCGFLLEIDHLNGKKLRLNNHSNVQVIKPGDKKVIPSYGMSSRDGDVGSLIIDFIIDFPELLTETQKTTLSEIL
jgi:DnaJ-class molecular chaperone